MTPEEVLEYVGQKVGGDPSRAIYGKDYKEIDNPLRDINNPNYDGTAPKKITVTVEQWKTPGGQVIFEGYRDPSSNQFVPTSQPAVKAETPAAGAVTATNTSTSYKWVESPGGGRRLHVITKDKDGNQIADDEATPAQQREYEVSEQRSRNPGGKSDAEIETEGKAAATKAEADKKDTETKKNTWHEVGRDVVDNKQTGVAETIIHQENGLGEKRDVKGTSTTVKEPEKPTIREDPNNPGKWISIQSDPSQPGGVRITSVAGPEGERTPIPMTGDVSGVLGDIVPNALKKRDELTAIYNAPGSTMSKADYEKQAAQIMSDANSRFTEQSNLLNAQNTITGQQAGQRRDTISQANNATQFASGAFERSLRTTEGIKDYQPGAGGRAAGTLQELLNMHNQYLKSVPGFSVPEPVQPTAFQQAVLTINPATGTIQVPMGGSGGGAPLNNIAGTMAAANGLPGPGAGVGPQGESLTRPGFSEGQQAPDFGSLMQEYSDPNDDEWNQAISQVGQEIGVA